MSGSTMAPDNLTTVGTNTTTSVYDTYGYYIHPHWKQFPLIPDKYHYIVGIYITIVGITGIIGNSIVIWIFSTTRNLKTPSNMLIMNLALSDLVFSAVNGFPLLTISSFNRKWMWGDTACQFYGFIGGLFGLMSIITLAAISLDRYYNIAEPLKAAQYMTRKKAFMMVVIVWMWSLVWAVPPLFGWGKYVPEGFQTSCTFDYISTEPHMRTYFVGMYLGGFMVPLMFIIVSYILIWKAIRKHDKEMLKMAKKMKVEDIRANKEKTNAEVRIAKIAMMIVFLYLLSWSPYAVVALIAQFGKAELITPYVSELPVMLAKAAAMHNPIVYAFSHPRFREALNKRVPWLMCCCDVKPTKSPNASRAGRSTKRTVSRQVSNDSYYVGGNDSDVSSCISQIDDYGQSIEMKRTVSETSFSRPQRRGPSNESPVADGASGDVVRELIQALVSVTNRQQAVPPHYTPNIQPQKNAQASSKEVYVIDNGQKVDISAYLAQLIAASGPNMAAANLKDLANKESVVKKDSLVDNESVVNKDLVAGKSYKTNNQDIVVGKKQNVKENIEIKKESNATKVTDKKPHDNAEVTVVSYTNNAYVKEGGEQNKADNMDDDLV